MLNLIIGRAGTGKTSGVLQEIKTKIENGETGILLIVPEQYSHFAERQLCEVCGDTLSLHGDTLSFTRLCSRVFMELGYPTSLLDEGGQILSLFLAMESVVHKLRIFGNRGLRVELLHGLLSVIEELKSFCISPENLEKISAKVTGPLSDKLYDLSVILSAYDSVISTYAQDSCDMLTTLAQVIGDSTICNSGHIYFDGFNDFTAQEQRVIEQLLNNGAQISVCLTYDPDDDSEVFELPKRTAGELRAIAKELDVKLSITSVKPTKADNPLIFMEQNLFTQDICKFNEKTDAVTVYMANNTYEECEAAAQVLLGYLRENGYRWHDIAIMARNWEQYAFVCENVFERYEIPYFSGGREDIKSKPPIAHLDAALEIATMGFEYKPVFKYLKTGLTGASKQSCALLENYVLKWNIRGSMWLREWKLPVDGYGYKPNDEFSKQLNEERLKQLNELRLQIVEPLVYLRDGLKGCESCGQMLKALYGFMEKISLPSHLIDKAKALTAGGSNRLADEYTQLWDVIIGSMEQMFEISASVDITPIEFRKLFSLVLSTYDVGVIPISMDRVAMGSMAMSRRRNIKVLIVLGATDENMPSLSSDMGVLSDNERMQLGNIHAPIKTGVPERLIREMNMIYSTLTLPSDKLIFTYNALGKSGLSHIVKNLCEMFEISPILFDEKEMRFHPPDAKAPRRQAAMSLSESFAQKLYGDKPALSPSRVDKYYSCPYQHFLYSGLRLKPRTAAAFDAAMAGTFMHFVLEGTTKEISDKDGFESFSQQEADSLVEKYIGRFVHEELFDFDGKNSRFIYLFHRLEDNARRILTDMIEELSHSEFRPKKFEFDISTLSTDTLVLPGDKTNLKLSGIVDRIDSYEKSGRLYLRVIDYKTGKKAFSLSDVKNGRDMQMLIYLFALKKYGQSVFGGEITPAGVLYVPARDVILKLPRDSSPEQINAARIKELRRGGLILNDPMIIEAMENTEEKLYLPVKISKEGDFVGDGIAGATQMELLSLHVDKMMNKATAEIVGGNIKTSPIYKNDNDNACVYCDYHDACYFDEQNGDRKRYAAKLKASEVWAELENEFKGRCENV